MSSTASLVLNILKVKRTRKTIAIAWSKGGGKFDLDETENPLPAFLTALEALKPVACRVIGVPDSYTENLRVLGITMGEQGQADTVSFVVRKGLADAAKELAFNTPPRLLSHPTEPGSYTPPLSDADCAAVYEMIEQAKAYVKGERAQGTLPIEGGMDDDDAPEDDGEEALEAETLPFPKDSEITDEPKKKKRTRKAGGK